MTATVIDGAHGDYALSTDPARLDLDVIHGYLSGTSYWAKDRARDVTERAIAGSGLVIGAYTIVEHPDVVSIKTQFLATGDAHELYEKFGYTPLAEPKKWMHRIRLP